MFEELVAATTGAVGAGAVAGWARVENAACARRLVAMTTVLDACPGRRRFRRAGVVVSGRLGGGVRPDRCCPAAHLRRGGAPVIVTGTPPPAHTGGLTMPRRRRTQHRRQRIDDEREHNRIATELEAELEAAEREARAQARRQALREDPPPF